MKKMRPNMVLFMPDQLRADAVGCFGNPAASTPHIDELAATGLRFNNAFANHPVCGPSRVSLMTGWYPHVNGNRTLSNLLKPHEPNMLRLLKDAGYAVAWAGARGDTFAPGVTETSTNFAGFTTAPTQGFGNFGDPSSALFDAYYDGLRPPSDDGGPWLDFDEAAIRTAEEILADPPPEPWVLFVALIFPHLPFQVEDPWYSAAQPSSMPTPSGVSASRKPAFQQELRRRYGTDRLDADDWAEISRTYYAMVSRVDDQLGRVRHAVDQTGAADHTAWMFFTDHGEYLGDHGLVEKWPSGLDDCLLRNPLIISTPDGPEGAVADGLVELIDLMPTVLELADTTARHTHFGRSLMPLLQDPHRSHRDAAFSEGGFNPVDVDLFEGAMKGRYAVKTGLQQELPDLVGKAISLRTTDWTYIYRQAEDDELYSRLYDPDEHLNLLDNPTPQSLGVVADVREQMLAWTVDTSDVIRWDRDPRFPRLEEGWR